MSFAIEAVPVVENFQFYNCELSVVQHRDCVIRGQILESRINCLLHDFS